MFANVVEQVAGPEGVFDGFRVKVGAIGGCEFTMTVTLDGARPFAVWGVLAPSLDALLQVGHGSPTARIGILLESEPNDANSITLDPVQVDPIFGQQAVHLDWQLFDADRRTLPKSRGSGGTGASRAPTRASHRGRRSARRQVSARHARPPHR
jgi:hypothetical protein